VGARVHLHVGLQKSGTTYLQHAWAGRLDELAAAGRRYPVDPSGRGEVPNHQLAFYGLVPEEFGWLAERGSDYSGSWAWLQDELARASTPLLLSAEALSTVRRAGAARVVQALGDDVEVLVTARRLDRLLASSWQQSVRNGRGTGFQEYLEAIRAHRAQLLADPADDEPNLSWRSFSVGSLVRRWSGLPGVTRVTVVVNSGRPAELLWHRMLEAVDLAPDAIAPVQVADGQTNEGLRWAEADILAALNRALSGPGWDQKQATAVRQAVIRNGFGDRESRGPGVTLPPHWQDEVADWAKEEVREVESSGARVVGPLSDLMATPEPAEPDSVVDLTTDDYSEAAAAALLGLLSGSQTDVKPRVLKRALQSVRRAAS
jgi:hypothetical protein